MIIIGAGFAGLAAGIYGRLNGYNTQVFEMHNQPGGLCTSWKRKGYTFDACVHWLVGSSPESPYNALWRETGVARDREFIYAEEYCRCEGSDGRTVIFYADIDRLESHLLSLSPQDEDTIREFINGIRMCAAFDFPSDSEPLPVGLKKSVATFNTFMKYGRAFREWTKVTGEVFANRFKDPLLKEAFREIWVPEFSVVFMLFTFAWLHRRNAGYPIGGSMPMSQALEMRYRELAEDRNLYVQKKDEIAALIIRLLEQRFPGISDQVEVTDVATPLTFERYTGNWKGSFEGWLITPENAYTITKPMPQTIPGLKNFYMCGQWVEPGGGLPTSIMSARRLLKKICREDGRRFTSK